MNTIKTWEERMEDDGHEQPISVYCRAEIAELRAALAARATPAQPEPSPSSVGAAIMKIPFPEPLEEVRAKFRGEFDYVEAGEDYYSKGQINKMLSEAAALAEQHQIPMTYVGTLALGCVEGDELSQWDIEPDNKAIDALQLELVRTTDDVHMCLYAVPFSATPPIAQDGQKSEGGHG